MEAHNRSHGLTRTGQDHDAGRFIVLCGDSHVPPVVESVGRAQYGAAARAVADAQRAEVVEWSRPLAVDGSHHVDDGVHLNDAAYAILTDSVLAAIDAVPRGPRAALPPDGSRLQ